MIIIHIYIYIYIYFIYTYRVHIVALTNTPGTYHMSRVTCNIHVCSSRVCSLTCFNEVNCWSDPLVIRWWNTISLPTSRSGWQLQVVRVAIEFDKCAQMTTVPKTRSSNTSTIVEKNDPIFWMRDMTCCVLGSGILNGHLPCFLKRSSQVLREFTTRS